MSSIRWTIAGLVLGLALAGCSEDPEPRIEPPTPSSTPTTSPSSPTASSGPTQESEPDLPPTATRQSDAGAKAFAKYWITVVNYAQATGDVSTLERLNDSRCPGCRGIANAITKPYEGGGRIIGGELTIGRLRKLPLDHGADWAGFAKGKTKPQTIVAGDGERTKSKGGDFYFYGYLAWTDHRWSMRWLRTPAPA